MLPSRYSLSWCSHGHAGKSLSFVPLLSILSLSLPLYWFAQLSELLYLQTHSDPDLKLCLVKMLQYRLVGLHHAGSEAHSIPVPAANSHLTLVAGFPVTPYLRNTAVLGRVHQSSPAFLCKLWNGNRLLRETEIHVIWDVTKAINS